MCMDGTLNVLDQTGMSENHRHLQDKKLTNCTIINLPSPSNYCDPEVSGRGRVSDDAAYEENLVGIRGSKLRFVKHTCDPSSAGQRSIQEISSSNAGHWHGCCDKLKPTHETQTRVQATRKTSVNWGGWGGVVKSKMCFVTHRSSRAPLGEKKVQATRPQ